MTEEEFCSRARAIFGPKGWKLCVCRITGRDQSTVKRWASGTADVPEFVGTMFDLIEMIPPSARPLKFQTARKQMAEARRQAQAQRRKEREQGEADS